MQLDKTKILLLQQILLLFGREYSAQPLTEWHLPMYALSTLKREQVRHECCAIVHDTRLSHLQLTTTVIFPTQFYIAPTTTIKF